MKNIGILVGEDADLPKNLIQQLPIITFPFVVEGWRGYEFMREKKENKPKTSQPSVKTFEKLFSDSLKIYEELLVITISSLLSGTYNSATQAKKLLTKNNKKRIHIIDSRISTGGEGLIVLKGAELISAEENINIVLEKLKYSIFNTHLLGVFEDPTFLQRGGRISNVQSFVIKNMLKTGFRPILTIKDGKIVTKKIQKEKDKSRALFAQFREEMLKQVQHDSLDNVSISITHADCEKSAKDLKKLVQEFNKNIKIEYINVISPVIGSHLGPDSLIISWIVE